jgi:hypothetical protein
MIDKLLIDLRHFAKHDLDGQKEILDRAYRFLADPNIVDAQKDKIRSLRDGAKHIHQLAIREALKG